MRTGSLTMLTALLLLTSLSIAAQQRTAGSSVHVVLVGDSTVTEESGWGLGFRERAGEGVAVINAAANGRSSKSYRDEGLWQRALAARNDYSCEHVLSN